MGKEIESFLFRKLKSPISVQIEVTTRCNGNCIYCYNYWKYKKNNSQNFDLSIEKIPDIVDELKINEVLNITITGGEPLFHEKATTLLMEKLEESNINILLTAI
jgi:7-carboxy-7-deazaguanine synthase